MNHVEIDPLPPVNKIVVIRPCAEKGCTQEYQHEILKQGPAQGAYGEAMRIMDEPWFCDTHKPQISTWDYCE